MVKKIDDATIIIMGMTGDLTRKKLFPAIYRLVKDKKIDKFCLVGVARYKQNIDEILSAERKRIGKVERKVWDKLKSVSYYQQLDFYKKDDYNLLKKFLERVENKHRLSGNRMFYLATLPQHFDTITENLAESKLAEENSRKWARVIYEKPFGDNLKSAQKINRCINRVFKERQIYRIDHYLGKELVGSIAMMRFTNRVLEPQWNHRDIESVQIILSENFGVEGRGGFYDKYGVMKDVIQNHALQLLALTAMEAPKRLDENCIRTEKAKVLQKTVVKDTIYGQYEGYINEKNVKENSTIPTFAALRVEINNQRWKGVPFFIKAGKNLDRKETSIHLKFKKVDCLLSEACPSDTNCFTMRIQPNDGFSLELNTKVPGKKNRVTPVEMDFCQKSWFGPNTPEAYETLLEDVINGDQSVFVRNDEIEHAWKIVEDVLAKKRQVYRYEKKSKGPKELKTWSMKNKVGWKA